MEHLLSAESFFSHPVLWKVVFGLVFFGTLLLFGNFFNSTIMFLKRTENRWGRYFYSTFSLLLLFFILKIIGVVYELFLNVLSRD